MRFFQGDIQGHPERMLKVNPFARALIFTKSGFSEVFWDEKQRQIYPIEQQTDLLLTFFLEDPVEHDQGDHFELELSVITGQLSSNNRQSGKIIFLKVECIFEI